VKRVDPLENEYMEATFAECDVGNGTDAVVAIGVVKEKADL
jgi:hypothetical protein